MVEIPSSFPFFEMIANQASRSLPLLRKPYRRSISFDDKYCARQELSSRIIKSDLNSCRLSLLVQVLPCWSYLSVEVLEACL